jgi:hypothetical protein
MRALFLLCVLLVNGCATTALLSDTQKRAMLEERCVQKVQPMLRVVALFSRVSDPDKRVCGCIAQKVDMARVDAIIAKQGEERDSAAAALLVESMPMIRDCARETGVLPR